MEIKDFTGLGQPITRLIDALENGVGALYRDGLVVIRERLASRARLLSAKADIEVESLRAIAAMELQSMKDEVSAATSAGPIVGGFEGVSPVQERLLLASYRQVGRRVENSLSVANRSVEYLESDTGEGVIEPRWACRFFETVRDVDSDQLQDYWARVLAREASRPGSVSLRTVAVLDTMTRREVEMIATVAGYAVGPNVLGGAPMGRNIRHLQDIGILSSESLIPLELTDGKCTVDFGVWIGELKGHRWAGDKGVSLTVFPYTEAGRTLSPLVDAHNPSDEDVLQAIKKSIIAEKMEFVRKGGLD